MAKPGGVVGVFDRVADTYDTVDVPWFGPIAAGLVDELRVQPGERVLDIGCGRGAALRPLALATGPRGRAVGFDLSPRMVELTARDLADLPQVTVELGDASAPQQPAGTFDAVASSLVLFFLPEPGAAVRAWSALLAPRGRLGVATFGEQDERWRSVDELFTPYLPPALADARTTGARGPFASDEGMERLLVDAGLDDVRTVRRTVEAVFRSAEHLVTFTWSHGQRAMWEHVPPDQHEEVRQAILTRAGSWADATGGFALSQVVRYSLGVRGG